MDDTIRGMDLIFVSIGLGLAGIDILGVFIIMAALSAGASKRSILTFALTVLIATVAVGLGLSITLGSSVSTIADFVNDLPNGIWVGINLVIAGLLLWWATARMLKLLKKKKPSKNESSLTKWIKYGLFIVGILFAVSALLDPSYLALIALAGHNGNVITMLIAHTLWILISQATLFIFAVAVLFDKHKAWMDWFQKFQRKHAKKLSIGLTVIIALVGLVFLVDLLTFFVTNDWLFA